MLARTARWLIAFALIYEVIGCLAVPLGDPEKSKVDDRFTGLWLQRGTGPERGTLVGVVPYDGRSYLVTYMGFTRDAERQVVAREEWNYKMWVTDVGGTKFVTLEPKDAATLLRGPGDQKSYIVARVSREGNVLTATDVTDKVVRQAGANTPAELGTLMAGRLGDPDLFGETVSFELLGPDRATEAKAILGAFGRGGGGGG